MLAKSETGGAWLSSARVVRCWVKSRNERNPYLQLLTREGEDSEETAGGQLGGRWGRRQIIMPLMTWATHVLQWPRQEKRNRKVERNSKKWSQFGLWAATRPHEVGVASNRGSACRGEYVPALSHPPPPTMGWESTKAGEAGDRPPSHTPQETGDDSWQSCPSRRMGGYVPIPSI